MATATKSKIDGLTVEMIAEIDFTHERGVELLLLDDSKLVLDTLDELDWLADREHQFLIIQTGEYGINPESIDKIIDRNNGEYSLITDSGREYTVEGEDVLAVMQVLLAKVKAPQVCSMPAGVLEELLSDD